LGGDPEAFDNLTGTPSDWSSHIEFGQPVPEEDWTENWFATGNHKYSHLSPPIDATYPGLIDSLNKYGVHPNQENEFVPGQPYVGDVDLPVFVGPDDVNSVAIFDENGNQIGVRNETMENHELHPGVVERTIVQQDGEFHIQTRGGGYGMWGGPNVWGDEHVWSDVDNRVIENLDN